MGGAAKHEEEREILQRIKSGDREAFGLIVKQHMQRAFYSALGLVGSHEDALDLSQDAFVRVYSARDRLDPERPFFPWYYKTLRNLCFNHLRNAKNRREKLDAASSWLILQAADRNPKEPAQHHVDLELEKKLRQTIESLAQHEREIIMLREFEGRPYKEIAELLDIPIGTVMSRLYSARKQLSKQMIEET